jgi:general stress protein 26
MTDLTEKFWDRISDSRTGMLGADKAPAAPMSHHAEAKTRTLWFITARDTDLGRAAQTGTEAQYTVANDSTGLYARIDGTLAAVTDPQKLEELWSVFAGVWFEDGKQDDDVQLMAFTLHSAEIWTTDGNLSFLYEIAKAKIGGGQPDAGSHGTLQF